MYDGQLFPRIINDTNNSLDIYTYKSNNTVRATIIKTIIIRLPIYTTYIRGVKTSINIITIRRF